MNESGETTSSRLACLFRLVMILRLGFALPTLLTPANPPIVTLAILVSGSSPPRLISIIDFRGCQCPLRPPCPGLKFVVGFTRTIYCHSSII